MSTSRKITNDKTDTRNFPLNLTGEFKKCYYAVKFNKGFLKDCLTTQIKTNVNDKEDENKITDNNQKTENMKTDLKDPSIMDLNWYLKNLNIPTDINNQTKKLNTTKTPEQKKKKNKKKNNRNTSNKKTNKNKKSSNKDNNNYNEDKKNSSNNNIKIENNNNNSNYFDHVDNNEKNDDENNSRYSNNVNNTKKYNNQIDHNQTDYYQIKENESQKTFKESKTNNNNISNSNMTRPKNIKLYSNIKNKSNTNSAKTFNTSKMKNSSYSKLEDFYEKLQNYENIKNNNMEKIRQKTTENLLSHMRSYPTIDENSLYIIAVNKRKPFYQTKVELEEKNLDKNFNEFYHSKYKNEQYIPTLKKNNSMTFLSKNYDNFYNNGIRWMEKKDKKIQKLKKVQSDYEDLEMLECIFKPTINKNTSKILNKSQSCDNLNNGANIYSRYITKLKPILSKYYEKNLPFYKHNRKTNSNVNKYKNIKISPFKNKDDNKKIKKNLNYKLNEIAFPKTVIRRNNSVDNINKISNKKNKKEITWKDILKQDTLNKKNNSELTQNNKTGKNYDNVDDLYKLNIMQSGAWNKDYLNKIIPKGHARNVLKDFI